MWPFGHDLGRQVVAEAEDRGGTRGRRTPPVARRLAGDLVQLRGSAALGMDESFSWGLERHALEDALPHPGEDLAGADLDEGGRTGLVHGDDGLAPAHGPVRALASSARTSVNGAALAQEKTGKAGSAISTSSSAARNGAAAGSIAGEWNAPATSRRMTRVLRSFATASVASSASTGPDKTIWPGALSLATVTPPASAISRASSRLAPTRASIEPLRASPIRRPRRTTSSSASSRLSTPAATSAASSPSEWPAPKLGRRSSASQPTTEAQKIAGCAKRVFSSTRAKGSSPTSSVTFSSSSGARWETRSRMSGVWLP